MRNIDPNYFLFHRVQWCATKFESAKTWEYSTRQSPLPYHARKCKFWLNNNMWFAKKRTITKHQQHNTNGSLSMFALFAICYNNKIRYFFPGAGSTSHMLTPPGKCLRIQGFTGCFVTDVGVSISGLCPGLRTCCTSTETAMLRSARVQKEETIANQAPT